MAVVSNGELPTYYLLTTTYLLPTCYLRTALPVRKMVDGKLLPTNYLLTTMLPARSVVVTD